MVFIGGLGAVKLSSGAVDFNKKLSAKHGWKQIGALSGKAFAEKAYCFQNETEKCGVECTPYKAQADCYNRDGMVGERTMQQIANSILGGTEWGKFWSANIVLPPSYKTIADPPPASDVKAEIAAGEGAAGKKHLEELAKKEQEKKITPDIGPIIAKSSSSGALIAIGLLAAAGGAYWWMSK